MIDYVYEKSVIGYLIGYYRKKDNRKLFVFLQNKKDYYNQYCLVCNKCVDMENICVPNTLYRIEKGNVLDNECYYFRLAENIGKTFEINSFFVNLINEYRNRVFECLLEFSEVSMLAFLKKIEKDILKYRSLIYIGEMLYLYKYVISVKLNLENPSQENLDVFYFLKDVVNVEDKMIILTLLYDVTFRKDVKAYTRSEIIDESKLYFDEPIFLKLKLKSIIDENLFEAQNVINDYISYKYNSLTNYQKYIIHDANAILFLSMSIYDKAYESIKECIKIAEDSCSLPYITLDGCYRKMGIISFLLGKYDEVILYLTKVLVNEHTTIGINYCLLFYALEKYNQTEIIMNHLNKIDTQKINSKYDSIIINYYRKKYSNEIMTKKNAKELELYICNEVVSVILAAGSMYEEIFRSDMQKYVSFTSNYKNYYIFEQLIHSTNYEK
ncbi:MAG: hypothetical protein IJ359_01475 [Erysipelotrichaceae bacterium]|nr:hypothetical protein [Erysipelotrichaceae bacterium]